MLEIANAGFNPKKAARLSGFFILRDALAGVL